MLTDEHASPSQQNEVPMDRDPEKDFKVATKKLEELWYAMNHVVGVAGRIIRRIKDDRPLPDSPPEMKIEYEWLFTHRKECVEAFNVGLEPTSATNSRLTHGYLSPYCIYKAAGVKPPKDVERGPFLFQAVIALAQHLIEIGWNGQPGIDTKCVHPVNMPSRDQLPAFRLCDNKRWEAFHVPFLMSEKIRIAFDNALSRERSRAEEVLRTRMIEAKRTMRELSNSVPARNVTAADPQSIGKSRQLPNGPFDPDERSDNVLSVQYTASTPPTVAAETPTAERDAPAVNSEQSPVVATPSAIPPLTEAKQPDPYAALRAFAEKKLIGKQSKIVKLLCDKGGHVSLTDIASVVGWDTPNGNWNSARIAINRNIKEMCWMLSTRNSHALLVMLKSKAKSSAQK